MNYRFILKRKLLLLFGDLVIIFASINFAYAVRFGSLFYKEEFNKYINLWIVLSMAYVFSFYIFDQYAIQKRLLNIKNIIFYISSLFLVFLIIIGYFYFFPFNIGRGIFVFSFIFTALFSLLWRNVYSSVFRIAFPKINVLLVGSWNKEKELYDLIKENPDYELIGLLTDDNPKTYSGITYLGPINSIEDVVHKHRVDDIVTNIKHTSSNELIHGLVTCKMKGVFIYDLPTFYENLRGQLPVLKIDEKWFFFSNGFEHLGDKLYRRVKRIMDFSVSLFIFFVSLPFCLFISLLIKLDSKGPVFYIQERLGENEKPFKLIKFRTMVKDAEKKKPIWAKKNDGRVTGIGKFLRRSRLDELPQLINIFFGNMSIIGPRPEREYFIRKLKKEIPFYSLRFSMKPGLTGWAQVNYQYGASVEDAVEKLMYDLYYIKNMSLFLDFRILLRTIRISLLGLGR